MKPHFQASLCKYLLAVLVFAIASPCAAGNEKVNARISTVDLRELVQAVVAETEHASDAPDKRKTSTPEKTTTDTAPDPLLENQRRATKILTTTMTLDVDVAGMGFTGAFPAEAIGDAGPEHYLQLVNGTTGSVLTVFDKDGAAVAGPAELDGLWPGEGPCATGWGSPAVLHDDLADRWLLAEIGAGNHLCVYISQSPDPVAGGWFAYDLALPQFPDSPRFAVWSDSYVAATSEAEPTIYVLDRTAVLAGEPLRFQRLTTPPLRSFGFQLLLPAHVDGPNAPPSEAPAVLARHVDGTLHDGQDRLELFELNIDWSQPGACSLTGPASIPLASFDSALCGTATHDCLPQPNTDQQLNPVREVLTSLRYRGLGDQQVLAGSFTVDIDGNDHAGVRWFELQRSGSGPWNLAQEGTFAPDASHRWIGGLAMDRDGNLALGYNVTSGSITYPSIRCAGRQSGDPPGVLTTGEVEVHASSESQVAGHSPELWGAFGSMSIDPTDDCTFWLTAAYAADGVWGTRVATLRFPSCEGSQSNQIFADGFESGDSTAWSASTPKR